MTAQPHPAAEAAGRPLRMFLTASESGDYIGARALLDAPPPAEHLLAVRG